MDAQDRAARAANGDPSPDRRPDLGRLLLWAHRDFGRRAAAKLRARGVTDLGLAHTALLATLDPAGTSISRLAERTAMTKQAMSELAADLERGGHVVRATDPRDRRVTTVVITDRGRGTLRAALEVKAEVEDEYAAILGRPRLAALAETLAAIVEGRHPPER